MSKLRGVLAPGRRATYALAGDAIITVMNPQTGTRFTYRITMMVCWSCEGRGDRQDFSTSMDNRYPCKACSGSGRIPHKYFVKVLTGPDNSKDYKYVGVLDNGKFCLTTKSWSGISMSTPSIIAFLWLVDHWENEKIEVWHEGVCGRCGRRLTVPESIESGIGPVCAARGAA